MRIKMPTLIFDFDSTLIDCESLEEILRKKLTPDDFEKAEILMYAALEGQADFLSSLSARLSLTPLFRSDFTEFGKSALARITPGIEAFIQSYDGEIWIISGAIQETLIPLAMHLHIPLERVKGVEAVWGSRGEFIKIENFTSKWGLARPYADGWSQPITAIGDAMTDYALYEQGLCDDFIAFTRYKRSSALISKGVKEASDISQLASRL